MAYAFAFTMLGTTLPTPLYPLYKHSIGFGDFALTVVFAVHALGVVAALFFGGGLSDQIGRRRVLAPALVISCLSAICSCSRVAYLPCSWRDFFRDCRRDCAPGPPPQH